MEWIGIEWRIFLFLELKQPIGHRRYLLFLGEYQMFFIERCI